MDEMLKNFRCGMLVATAGVDMIVPQEIGLSQRVSSPAYRSCGWRWSTAPMLISFGSG